MAVFTVVLGLGYTGAVTAFGQLVVPGAADGSLVRNGDGRVVGSALLAQGFEGPDGAPLREYFQPRPSAAGGGYDGAASGGSNQGPESSDLAEEIAERRADVARLEGVDPAAVPADAVTASGSGLDPDISVDYARLQTARVSQARHLDPRDVAALVDEHTTGRALGYLGEPSVDVLELNTALDARK